MLAPKGFVTMDVVALLDRLSREQGLAAWGVVPVGPTPAHDRYTAWLAQGYAADMAYLARPDALHKRADPRHLWPAARSLLLVAASYLQAAPPPLSPLHGRVARYAWGEDYHRWLGRRLTALLEQLRQACGPFEARWYVDTGPISERAWAVAAGLGWIGKNTTLIHPQHGSFTVLGVALLDIELPATPPLPGVDCGTCTRCLQACPTQALVAPGLMDARRCLSYLTIEHRGAIPPELRPALKDQVFGCDICQQVCPWNQAPLRAVAHHPAPAQATLDLPAILAMDETSFRARFRTSAIWRARREGLARNAAIVLGLSGDSNARPVLQAARDHDPSPLVREHATWALNYLDLSSGV